MGLIEPETEPDEPKVDPDENVWHSADPRAAKVPIYEAKFAEEHDKADTSNKVNNWCPHSCND